MDKRGEIISMIERRRHRPAEDKLRIVEAALAPSAVIAAVADRNRHCPKCQGAAAREWLAEREVYGNKGGYVIVNDRTREIVQLSDRTPGSGWIPDSRIKWNTGQ